MSSLKTSWTQISKVKQVVIQRYLKYVAYFCTVKYASELLPLGAPATVTPVVWSKAHSFQISKELWNVFTRHYSSLSQCFNKESKNGWELNDNEEFRKWVFPSRLINLLPNTVYAVLSNSENQVCNIKPNGCVWEGDLDVQLFHLV